MLTFTRLTCTRVGCEDAGCAAERATEETDAEDAFIGHEVVDRRRDVLALTDPEAEAASRAVTLAMLAKIEEQDAIYYIGETPVANRETLVFDITVTPEGVSEASDIRFKRQFYTK